MNPSCVKVIPTATWVLLPPDSDVPEKTKVYAPLRFGTSRCTVPGPLKCGAALYAIGEVGVPPGTAGC